MLVPEMVLFVVLDGVVTALPGVLEVLVELVELVETEVLLVLDVLARAVVSGENAPAVSAAAAMNAKALNRSVFIFRPRSRNLFYCYYTWMWKTWMG